ncbi:S1C family serine protease [Streptosporangium sp. NPDC000509]|uniref:S1C family serine protease n=1 Tax=Streptosporangium sp. NPDC000509 TaxID=3366186 RepID=UPI0036B2F708
MTDDARTAREANDAEGRTPSEFADGGHETQESRRPDLSGPEFSRPEFLPAGEGAPFQAEQPRDDDWSRPGAQSDHARWGRPQDQPESLHHDRHLPPDEGDQGPGPVGHSWGDPSGRPPRQDTMVFASQSAQPPPPAQAFGMGPGWAPPPGAPVGPGGFGGFGGSPPRPVRSGPRTTTLVILGLVIALLASTLGSVGTYLLTKPAGSGRDPSFSLGGAPTGSNVRPPESVAGVASKVLPSVVSLAVEGGASSSTGSGFLIKGGYVVTNNHVVANADSRAQIQIQFNNRKSTSAVVVGRDPESDLAVVKPAETFGAPEIVLGNSDNVVVGDPVIAIGSPLGLTGTVTSGIVSSLNRPVQAGEENSSDTTWLSAVQTDAAINPGNSGGPLVNVNGEVIGVNSAIATLGRSVGGQSGSIGLGFAIPVNHARRVAEELITTGKAKKSRIGVAIDPTYQGVGVRIATESRQGTQPVEPNGPAAQAGLKPGDVILEIDGVVLQDGNELIAMIRNRAPGEKLAVKYQRGGEEKTATVTVGTAPEQPSPQPS